MYRAFQEHYLKHLLTNKLLVMGLSVLLLFSLSSCVGKKRYLSVLQQREEAIAEAAFAKTSYEDAVERWQILQVELFQREEEVQELQLSGQEQKSGDMAEQQRLLNELRLTQLLLDSLSAEASGFRVRQGSAKDIFVDLDQRLNTLMQRLGPVVAQLPKDQYQLLKGTDFLSLSFPAAFLFGEKRFELTAKSDIWLTELASALGGQSDLLIQVIAEPIRSDGSPAAREEAAKRASIVSASLVELHGLSPELVLATARQTWPEFQQADAPAEAREGSKITLEISIDGDWLGRVRQSLK